MPDLITETHAFAGFRRGRQYQLTFERRRDGAVDIVLDHHEHASAGAGPLVAKFEW